MYELEFAVDITLADFKKSIGPAEKPVWMIIFFRFFGLIFFWVKSYSLQTDNHHVQSNFGGGVRQYIF